MNYLRQPEDFILWNNQSELFDQLNGTITADVAIVGGGIAGLSAAQAFCKHGKKVVLVEKTICGGGATGKSSGFITPDSEIPLRAYVSQYGKEKAKRIWDFSIAGGESIRKNILDYNLSCDYQPQNTLVVAKSKPDFKKLVSEYESRVELGYEGKLISPEDLHTRTPATGYFGAVEYSGSFGINPFEYCQSIKQMLKKEGVEIYEGTPALSVQGNKVITAAGSVTADSIILCLDKFAPDLDVLTQEVYHAQTFMLASEKLTQEQVEKIFAEDTPMAWDTDLIYTYFRLTGDKRLLIGGGSLLTTYARYAIHDSTRLYNKLNTYVISHFGLHLNYPFMWQGLIGLSKDIRPLYGQDEKNPSLYYISAATGLPWAAALGNYSARHILQGDTEFAEIFSYKRDFAISGTLQRILGTRLTFALSNYLIHD